MIEKYKNQFDFAEKVDLLVRQNPELTARLLFEQRVFLCYF